ncbi:MAG: substrate-binding domain-containing protein [Anaerolineae bacterium]|nr:substrate-binding domain-containing protein [Anaerolineae bacterium]
MQHFKHSRPTIGVLAGWQVHAGTPDSFLHQIYRGVDAAARDNDCNVLMAYGIGSPRNITLGRPAWPLLIPEADFVPVGPWNTDGLIVAPPIAPSEYGKAYFQDLLASGYPIVHAGSGEISGPAVVPDNKQGLWQALTHLRAHGHRHIAFIAGNQREIASDSGKRLRIYQAFLREYGLEENPDLIAYGYHQVEGGRRAMEQILQTKAKFTAVAASNDTSAIGAIQALQNVGLTVPYDVAFVGFDDRVEARALVPQLTTVHYPIFEIGYQATVLLLKYILGQITEEVTICVPTRLVIRESCGCLPGEEVGLSFPPPETVPQSQTYPHDQIIQRLTEVTFNETHRLSLTEIQYLCQRLFEAYKRSVTQGDSLIFRLAAQQIFERAAALEDDLHAWQAAITVLQEQGTSLQEDLPPILTSQQVMHMLHQARIAISEIAQGQFAQYLTRQTTIANQMNQMTARFHTAQDEATIFETLAEILPSVGIQHAAVAFYEAEDDDPVAWSHLQAAPADAHDPPQRFASRDFPPPGLYATDAPFRLTLLPLLTKEGLLGFVAYDVGNLELCADITLQLVAALRGVQLYREAMEGRQLAEEANRLKSRFLSMVSHELRTPLNLISGLSDLLLRETRENNANPAMSEPTYQEDLERIYVSAQHLDSLIRDVLDLATSEVGQLRLTREPLDLLEVLKPVAIIGEQLACDKHLTWYVQLPPALPRVWGDRTRLRQVALNLVNNAIKFTHQGTVTLRAERVADTVCVTITDNGLGIPQEEQAVIFDEFRQSERTSSRGYGGLGLGLAICKRLVELHDGTIGVYSSGEEGSGSTFYFSLPIMEQSTICKEPALTHKHRIWLLTEDIQHAQPLYTYLIRQALAIMPYSVNSLLKGIDCPSDMLPDAIIMDRESAAHYGWEVLKYLKQSPATQHIPVLFYSLSDDGKTGDFLEMNYLTKPVGTTELAEILRGQGLLDLDPTAAQPHTILIVDDEPGILEMHARIVQNQFTNYRVLKAHNGLEALDSIRKYRPDLVLLDLMMPELDGFGVLEAMRSEELSHNIPVIILTGQILTTEDMARLNRGVVSVLGKGLFTVNETLCHIETVLKRHQKTVAETQNIVLKAIAYIHTHYAAPLSREEIAAHIGLSERHLTRCFRQEMNITPITYLNRYRIQQAKALLEAGEKSITEIALMVGFSSGGYFTRVFRQETGLSPREYQRT